MAAKKEASLDKTQDIIVEWNAPARIFKKRGKDYFSTIAAIVFLLTIILFVAREFLLIGVVLTFAFFAYVLATVEPEKIENKLTKKGVWISDKFYHWEELTDFWIEHKHDSFVYHINMPFRAPGRLILLTDEAVHKKILSVFTKRLVYHEKPIKSRVDRAADWLTAKVRLDRSS